VDRLLDGMAIEQRTAGQRLERVESSRQEQRGGPGEEHQPAVRGMRPLEEGAIAW
jgi:hypothetical protein